MKFADLRDMSLSEFVEQSRDPSAFWFFLHVPKTAGSSFATELRTRLAPYRNIYFDPLRKDLSYAERLHHALDTFLSLPGRARFRSASGHLRFDMAKRLREAIPHTRMVTVLRTPEERLISGYRYQRTPMNGPHERFKRDFPTLESWVEHPRSRNTMARYIGGRGAVDRKTLLRRAEEEFAFVGLLEAYPMSFNVAFDIMGFPGLVPTEHRRKTPETQDTAVEVTPAILKRIRELNARDIELYEHVEAILLPHRAEWEARMAKAEPAEA